jgi:hypothetical protein
LEQLLHVLNNGGFPDFRVLSGSSLGQLIDTMREQHLYGQLKPVQSTAAPRAGQPVLASKPQTRTAQLAVQSGTGNQSNQRSEQSTSPSSPFASIAAQFREYMEQNKLIRLKIHKGLGVSLNIPGRIINIDEVNELLTVYHVDEKQVYTFKLNEIDDFSI